MFDLLEARPIYDLRGHEKAVTAVSFSPKGDYIVSGGKDNLVFLWKTNIDDVERARKSCDREGALEKLEQISCSRKEIDRVDALTEKIENRLCLNDKENKINKSNKSEKMEENLCLKEENVRLKEELCETKEKVETLMETVILMEKRITLLEDQIRLSQTSSFNDDSNKD